MRYNNNRKKKYIITGIGIWVTTTTAVVNFIPDWSVDRGPPIDTQQIELPLG